MHPYLKWLQFGLGNTAFLIIGMWVFRGFKPGTQRLATATVVAACGLILLGITCALGRQYDPVLFFYNIGLAGLSLGMATTLIFMKGQPSAGPTRQ